MTTTISEYAGMLSVLIGAALLLAVGPLIGRFINGVSPWSKVEAPPGVSSNEWQSVIVTSGTRAAAWIGRLESLIVYFAVLYAKSDAALAIGGWLAFKVASKWETWSNVIKVPDKFDGVSQLDSLRARRAWGFALYERFLIGTLVNVLTGMLIAWLVLRYGHAV